MEFTAEEREILSQFVTNVDSNVFALKNLPEVVKGALFARYSRSTKSLKRLLLDEFIKDKRSLFEEIRNFNVQQFSNIDVERAEEFYDRVLIGFGDDSVAELAFAHLAVEDVSILGTKVIEDSRIGISPLEKSTRYVYFDQKVDGKYRYYQADFAELTAEYEDTMNFLFDLYSAVVHELQPLLMEKYPKPEGVKEGVYKRSIRAKACDLARNLLPAGTLTNVGLAGNGRAFEYLIIKLRAHPLPEIRKIAEKAYVELRKVIPSFVKRSFDEKGDAFVSFLKAERKMRESLQVTERKEDCGVRLLAVHGSEEDVLAALVFSESLAKWEECMKKAKEIDDSFIENYLSLRKNRRHKPHRAFELISYTFEIVLNFGAYRDLHRHRILTQMRQPLTPWLGYDVPAEIKEFGFAQEWKEAMERAKETYSLLEPYGMQASYVVPLAYRVRMLLHLNLREAFHLCELRSSPQGHQDYREVAIKIAKKIQEVHPHLGKMLFLNTQQVDLERLEAELRAEKKKELLAKKWGWNDV